MHGSQRTVGWVSGLGLVVEGGGFFNISST